MIPPATSYDSRGAGPLPVEGLKALDTGGDTYEYR